MDFHYPLKYKDSGLQIVEKTLPTIYSQVYYFLQTFKQERYLAQDFGIDSGLLFDVDIPELLEQNINIDLTTIIPPSINYQVSTVEADTSSGKVTLRIDFLSPREAFDQLTESISQQFQFDN